MAPFGASRAGLMSVAEDDIPDSLEYQYFSTEQQYADSETVDPFEDSVEPKVDLPATGSPTLNADSLNTVDAVELDGSNDEYDYDYTDSIISEPCTLLFALRQNPSNDIETLWDDINTESRIQNQVDNNRWFLRIDDTTSFGSTDNDTGDLIISLPISASDGADLRVNGDVKESLDASDISSDLSILQSGKFMSEGGDRFVTGLWGGLAIHTDAALSGSDLEAEEGRLESEFNMDVL